MLGHKVSFNKFQNSETLQSQFSTHNEMKLKINKYKLIESIRFLEKLQVFKN